MAAPTITSCIEGPGGLPVVAEAGLNTLQNINFNSGSNTCDLPASTTINGSAVAGIGVISSSSTTATAFSVTNSGVFTGTNVVAFIGNSLTTGTLFTLSTTGQTDGKALLVTGGGANISSTGIVASFTGGANTDGSVVKITSTGVYAGTVGIFAIASAATTGTSVVQANTALTTGIGFSLTSSGASQTSAKVFSIVQSGTTASFTGSVFSVLASSTTGSGNAALFTGVNTTAGDVVKIVNNAITVGTGTLVNLSHTTSVLGAGTSMLRISSTGIDTGTTTGVLLDLSTTSGVGQTNVLLTDSSADTALRVGIFSKITNTAAVLAVPLKTSNVAVVNSKFTKQMQMTDGTKTVAVWLSRDNTDPNTVLTGVKGDICLNSVGGFIAVCTADGTSWTTMG